MAFLQICLYICAILPNVISRPPNILLILADDLGWNDVSYHKSEIETPNIDRLAGSGIKLNNYYIQPLCTPSRSQLMSGKYQIHTGLQHGVISPPEPNGLPLTIPTLADILRKQGYSTHAIGKWHLGFYKKVYTPVYRGFDSFYGYLVGAEDYYTHRRSLDMMINGTMKEVEGLDFRHNMNIVTNQNGSYSTHLFADRAVKLVKQHSLYNGDQPLFIYMPFQAVHAPLEVPKIYEEKYSFIKNKSRRIYAGMVSAMDEAIGKVIDAYKEAGLWNNTVLVFSTDNGGQVHAGGNNWPLRGWKGQLWEGGIRGIGFVHSPLLKNKGTIYDGLVHISDWYPTLVHLAGGSTSQLHLDGHDVWSAISETLPSPRKELLHNIDPRHPLHGERSPQTSFDIRVRAAVRVGDWKLLTGDPGPGQWIPPPHYAYDQTMIASKPEKNLWLFNLRKDPLEKNDLSVMFPDVVRHLLDRLKYYNSTAVPVCSPPWDPEADPALHGGVWGPWRD